MTFADMKSFPDSDFSYSKRKQAWRLYNLNYFLRLLTVENFYYYFMRIQFSFDDGAKQDIGLAQMLKQYGFEKNTIFFVPNNCELPVESLRELSNQGFELGGHTQSHPNDMKLLNEEQLIKEIGGNAKWLEDITGKKPKWFCYPSGRYNEDTIRIVKKFGFEKARTVLVGEYKQPKNNFRIATSVHIYPNRKEYKGKSWLAYAYDILEKASREKDGVFHVWGHSFELAKYNLFDEFEELLKKIEQYNYSRD